MTKKYSTFWIVIRIWCSKWAKDKGYRYPNTYLDEIHFDLNFFVRLLKRGYQTKNVKMKSNLFIRPSISKFGHTKIQLIINNNNLHRTPWSRSLMCNVLDQEVGNSNLAAISGVMKRAVKWMLTRWWTSVDRWRIWKVQSGRFFSQPPFQLLLLV